MSEAETRAIDRASPIPFYYQLQEILKEEIERGMYVLALIAVVVSVDILFFRHHFTERLIANVGIVLLIFRGLGRRQE